MDFKTVTEWKFGQRVNDIRNILEQEFHALFSKISLEFNRLFNIKLNQIHFQEDAPALKKEPILSTVYELVNYGLIRINIPLKDMTYLLLNLFNYPEYSFVKELKNTQISNTHKRLFDQFNFNLINTLMNVSDIHKKENSNFKESQLQINVIYEFNNYKIMTHITFDEEYANKLIYQRLSYIHIDKKDIEQYIPGIEVKLDCQIFQKELTIKELFTLKKGSFIPISSQQKVIVKMDQNILFSGVLIQDDNKELAIQIEEE